MYPEIYAKLGKVSIGTLQRWKRTLGNSNNYAFLIPNYHYEDYSRTSLTDYEKQIFLKLLLHPNKFSIGKAISLTQYVLKTQGQEYIPAPPAFRRFAKADRITLTHPLAHYTGEIKDVEDYKQKIQKQKKLKNKTIKACKEFLRIKYKTLKPMSYQTYKTFIYAQIIPHFKTFCMKDLTVQDIQDFKKYMQENKVFERRIKNIRFI